MDCFVHIVQFLSIFNTETLGKLKDWNNNEQLDHFYFFLEASKLGKAGTGNIMQKSVFPKNVDKIFKKRWKCQYLVKLQEATKFSNTLFGRYLNIS